MMAMAPAPGFAAHPGMAMVPPGMNWAVRPFSHTEHSAFLDAMERYGQENTGTEWEKIAQAVGNNRTVPEVRMHAHDYFVNLQMVTQVESDARVLGSKIKKEDWTFEQDMVFEHAMAEFEEADPLRCLKVASLLPGKSQDDVRHRYQRLIYDVHKIENAMPMEVKFKAPKAGKSLLARVAAKPPPNFSGRSRGVAAKASSSAPGHGGGVGGRDAGPAKVSRTKAGGKGKGALKIDASHAEKDVKPTKGPGKNKVKGKGGGYLLSNKSSSPRGPRGASARSQRAGAATADSRGSGTRGSAAAAAGGPRGASSSSGPRGAGTRGSGGTSSAALKRSAVAHLANLKRARVDEGDALRRPTSERGSTYGGVGRGMRSGGGMGGGGALGGGGIDESSRRKSGRARKRKAMSGQAGDYDDEAMEDEYQSGPHPTYHHRR